MTEPFPLTLHLNSEPGFRGGEVQTLGLVQRLEAHGFGALLMARQGGPLLERALSLGLRAVPWRPRGELDLAAAFSLRRLIRREKVALIHAHTAHALTLALLARGHSKGPPIVAHRRVSFPLKGRFSLAKYRRADAIIAVAGAVRDALAESGLDPERLHVVHSGVDLERFKNLPSKLEAREAFGIDQNHFVIGVVGALVAHKGHGAFLDAFNRFATLRPDALALFVGDGPLRAALEKEAFARGLRVHFTGQVEEPAAAAYPAMDMLVLPSSSGEGSPGVIKEAAAALVPVIAADVSGTGEILRNNEEALLVPPRSPKEMASAMTRLAADASLRQKLVQNARERVEAFSMDATAAATAEIYRSLLALARR